MKPIMPIITAASLLASSAVLAQTTPPVPGQGRDNPTQSMPLPSAPPEIQLRTPGDAPAGSGPRTLTEEQAKAWIDKAVYSVDNKNVGDVAAVQRDAAGVVTELHADVGGFLGLGTTRVRVAPSQFVMVSDRIVLKLRSDQVKDLPKIAR